MSAAAKLFVTGATGHLGGLVIEALLTKVPAHAIVAGARDRSTEAAVNIGKRGVEVRVADYSRPDTLVDALLGIDRLLLISSSENGKRKEQHRNVIAAAKQAGVGLVAYTSILHAGTSPLFLAEEHRDTETALKESGLPFVLLRNGWYNEVYTWRLPLALKTGTLSGAAGDGRISSAARIDYAEAAATVLTGEGHAGRTYELAGDDSFTLSDLAVVAGTESERPISYRNMTATDFRSVAERAGVPALFAMVLSDTDEGVAKGALFDDSNTLSRLIGRPTTPFRKTIADFINEAHRHNPVSDLRPAEGK